MLFCSYYDRYIRKCKAWSEENGKQAPTLGTLNFFFFKR